MRLSPLALLISTVLASGLSACSNDNTDNAETQITAAIADTPAPVKKVIEEKTLSEQAEDTTATTDSPAEEPLAFAHPESVVLHADKMYISNVGKNLAPTEKDEDGFVLITDADGKLDTASKLDIKTKLHAPKGMMVSNNVLYLTDINFVYGFNLEDNAQVFAVEPGLQHPDDPQPQFLNDIVAESDKAFFVSATDTNTIYRISNDFVPAIFRLEIDGELTGPNGLAYDAENKKLYVAGWGTNNQANGELGVIDLSGEKPFKYTRLGKHSGHLDGLVHVGDFLYFSDWVDFEKSGLIYRYNLKSGETRRINRKAIAGPADFLYDEETSKLIIPAMLNSSISTLPLRRRK